MPLPQDASRKSLVGLAQRWITTLHMAALATQIVLALLLLGAGAPTLRLHSYNALIIVSLALMQGLCLLWRLPPGARLYGAASVLVLLAEVIQITLGRTGHLPSHITVGTIIWGLSLYIYIGVWAPTWGRRAADHEAPLPNTSDRPAAPARS